MRAGVPVNAWLSIMPRTAYSYLAMSEVLRGVEPTAQLVPEQFRRMLTSRAMPQRMCVPYCRGETPWLYTPRVSSRAIAAWVRRFGVTPVAYVHLPQEQRSLAYLPILRPNGRWGLMDVSLPEDPDNISAVAAAACGLERAVLMRRLFGGEALAVGPSDSARVLALLRDGTVEPTYRQRREAMLIDDPSPGNARLLARAADDETVRRWLTLSIGSCERVVLPSRMDFFRLSNATIEHVFAPAAQALLRCNDAIPDDDSHMLRKRLAAWAKFFGYSFDGNDVLRPPDDWNALTAYPALPTITAFGEFVRRYFPPHASATASAEYCYRVEHMAMLSRLGALHETAADYRSVSNIHGPRCTVDLWRRDPVLDAGVELDAAVWSDLGIQVLLARMPSGVPLGGMVLRLMQHHLTGKTYLLGHAVHSRWYPYGWWFSAIDSLAQDIARWCNVELISDHEKPFLVSSAEQRDTFAAMPQFAMHSPSTYPLYPITAPLPYPAPPPERVLTHPHASLHPAWQGAYEAVVPVAYGPVITLPGAAEAFESGTGIALAGLVRRHINPDPLQSPPEAYAQTVWAFAGSRGRSVAYALGAEGIRVAGQRWHHAVSIGLGLTQESRYHHGESYWDGRTDTRRALRRMRFTWMLHHVAGQFGVRAPLTVALWNNGVPRDPADPHETFPPSDAWTVALELRRDIVRFGEIGDADDPWETVHPLLMAAKHRLGVELGIADLDDEHFVHWTATTLGQQLAILSFFSVDHGCFEGSPQLHEDNGSLAVEFGDYETARMNRNVAELHRTGLGDTRREYISLAHIMAMERAARRRGVERETTWVARFLRLAPQVRFGRLARESYAAMLRRLQRSGVDPVAAVRAFSREHWAPFLREHRQLLRWKKPV